MTRPADIGAGSAAPGSVRRRAACAAPPIK